LFAASGYSFPLCGCVNQIPFETKTVDDILSADRQVSPPPSQLVLCPRAAEHSTTLAEPNDEVSVVGSATRRNSAANSNNNSSNNISNNNSNNNSSNNINNSNNSNTNNNIAINNSYNASLAPYLLPLIAEGDEQSNDDDDQGAPRPRALLVDDTPLNTKMLRLLLQRLGVVCDEAENGAVAVDMIWRTVRDIELGAPAASGYSLVFMDSYMPVMDGLTAARIIRADLRYKSIIVGCWLDADEQEVGRFVEAGADFVVRKPLRYNELQQLLAYAQSADYQSLPDAGAMNSPWKWRAGVANGPAPRSRAPGAWEIV
jgi:CheY-like chemotaxis protein